MSEVRSPGSVPPSSSTRSAVVLLRTGQAASAHERQVHRHLAIKIAGLLGIPFAGVQQGSQAAPQQYVVPDATLIAPQPAISVDADLYGGVVSHPFIASKAISHPLVDPAAHAPEGWNTRFIELAGDAVLPGYSAFDVDDALRAGRQLLQQGAVRAKQVEARAGRGQQVVHSLAELEYWLGQQDMAQVRREGLVLERNLSAVTTYSVGQARVGSLVASYFGTQKLTRANDGEAVYGGSDLWVVRGDYPALLRQLDLPLARRVIGLAQRYEQAAEAAFPGFIASRRNCDVAIGRDPAGQPCSGVLEQSWRIGGASSAEIHALAAFAAEPTLQRIQASSWEIYGVSPPIPDGALVLYQGDDPSTGPLTTGVRLSPWQPPVKA